MLHMAQPLWSRKRPRKILNEFKVGHGDPKSWILDGFLEIFILSIDLDLVLSGIITRTDIKLLNAQVKSQGVRYSQMLADSGGHAWIRISDFHCATRISDLSMAFCSEAFIPHN